MQNAIKGALLSGLVFPGLGQLVLRKYRRAAVIMLAVLASLSLIVIEILQQALAVLDEIELQGDAVDMLAITDTVTRESAGTGSVMTSLLMLFVVVCWIAATIDAYRTGRKIDLEHAIRGDTEGRQ